MRQLPLGVRIPDRAVFATFLPARNAQVTEHLTRLARGESAGTAWVCGPHGAGKTHLLQATCVQASETMRAAHAQASEAMRTASVQPGEPMRAAYFPLSELRSLGPEVLEGAGQLDCLCLDDVDAVSGNLDWERALFGILREIDERGGRLVVSAVSPPSLVQWALPDLGSRFTAALVFQLRALDEEEQQEALRLRAHTRGFELPDETSRWLQRRFPRDMRALYELLDTLDEAALVAQRRLTVPFIRSVLRDQEPAS